VLLHVYRGKPEAHATLSPADMQKHMDQWGAWIGQAMQEGWMLDPGDALQREGKVVNAKVVTDGPFVESKEVVGGFSIVQANSIDDASKLAKGCPGLLVGGSVEVRPMAGFGAKP
jgi:hypothetical protein